jgi:hypothetical protein
MGMAGLPSRPWACIRIEIGLGAGLRPGIDPGGSPILDAP